MTSAAWNEVKQETISKCFRKCWGDVESPEAESSQDDSGEDDIPLLVLWEQLQLDPSLTIDDYVNVDRDVITNDFESEDDILTLLSSEIQEPEETDLEEDDGSPLPPPLTTNDAIDKLRELQWYFSSQEKNTEEDFKQLYLLEPTLLKKLTSLTQSRITDFFSS
jgi:hypothetical protein